MKFWRIPPPISVHVIIPFSSFSYLLFPPKWNGRRPFVFVAHSSFLRLRLLFWLSRNWHSARPFRFWISAYLSSSWQQLFSLLLQWKSSLASNSWGGQNNPPTSWRARPAHSHTTTKHINKRKRQKKANDLQTTDSHQQQGLILFNNIVKNDKPQLSVR